MAQTLSIILAQYYPDKMQLRHTLDSLLMQDTYDFELIIADDGSPEDYWDDTRAYLAAHGFTNVKLSKNKVNQGTVTNMLHAVELGQRPVDRRYLAGRLCVRCLYCPLGAGHAAQGRSAGGFWQVRLLPTGGR